MGGGGGAAWATAFVIGVLCVGGGLYGTESGEPGDHGLSDGSGEWVLGVAGPPGVAGGVAADGSVVACGVGADGGSVVGGCLVECWGPEPATKELEAPMFP